MIYLLALIGLVVVVVLLWKSFGPAAEAPRGRVTGPDDDPEFLWKMNKNNRSRDRGPGPDAGTTSSTE